MLFFPVARWLVLLGVVFTTFASAVWALLAVVANQDLHKGAMAYGVLNGCLGAGAVLGAFTLPRLRRKFSADVITAGATLVFVCSLSVLALSRTTRAAAIGEAFRGRR